ncbi:MAG TPA: nitroreductase family protein [Actinomycetota bacterium]|jgi:nitroreductase|nr:nitroreductase family protein [Actinomycetota bacterium]
MEFQEVVKRRRMVRNFSSKPVPREIVERILSNALHAPSAGFTQGWEFLVLQGKDARRFWDVTFPDDRRDDFRWQGLFNAPVIVVPLSSRDAYLDRYAEPDKGWTDRDAARWPVPYWDIDTGFASLLMLLTAVDEGLGALFFGIFRPEAFRAAYGIPERFTPIGAIAIGYPAPDEPSPSLKRGRRPVEEVVHRGTW